MNKDDIIKLAELSRLEINDTEAESYRKDFEGILGYVDAISSVTVEGKDQYATNLTTNMMREDDEMYTPGSFSEDILHEAPSTEDGYFKVKKVL